MDAVKEDLVTLDTWQVTFGCEHVPPVRGTALLLNAHLLTDMSSLRIVFIPKCHVLAACFPV